MKAAAGTSGVTARFPDHTLLVLCRRAAVTNSIHRRRAGALLRFYLHIARYNVRRSKAAGPRLSMRIVGKFVVVVGFS